MYLSRYLWSCTFCQYFHTFENCAQRKKHKFHLVSTFLITSPCIVHFSCGYLQHETCKHDIKRGKAWNRRLHVWQKSLLSIMIQWHSHVWKDQQLQIPNFGEITYSCTSHSLFVCCTCCIQSPDDALEIGRLD